MSQKKRRPPGRRAGKANRSFQSALAAYQQGQHKKAVRVLTTLLSVTPNHLDAVTLLSRISAEQGDLTKAVKLMERAASLAPEKADYDVHLAELHYQNADKARAYQYLEKAFAKDNKHSKAIDGLASLGFEIARETKDPKLWLRAADHLELFCELRPNDLEKHWMLADIYDRVGDQEKRCDVLRRLITLEGDTSAAHHLLAAAEGQNMDKVAPDYVSQVFDAAAESFEESLLHQLQYQTPQHIAQLLTRYRSPDSSLGHVLDLGCGTGLMGRAIEQPRTTLVGVDISTKMLEQAAEHGGYTSLIASEIDNYLQELTTHFDCILAADVFIYFGDLCKIFEQTHCHLREHGLFSFSIEVGQSQPYQLASSGRFTHQHAYIMQLADETGYTLITAMAAPLRIEGGQTVDGICYLFGKVDEDETNDGLGLRGQHLYEQASVHYHHEEYERAFNAAQQCLASEPDHAEALDLLGLLEASRANFDLALPMVERAATLVPDNPSFRMHLGMILTTMGLHERAALAFEKALTYLPEDPVLLVNYGVSLRMSGRTELAIKTLRAVLDRFGHVFEVHFNLAAAYHGIEDFESSKFHLDCALRMSSDAEQVKADFLNLLRTDS